MIEPNDLPLVCIPLELPAPAAAELLDFLHQLTATIERQYTGGLLRHQRDLEIARRGCDDYKTPF